MKQRGKLFSVSKLLSPGAKAEPEDVRRTKRALSLIGVHPRLAGDNSLPDRDLFSGIESFQAAEGLDVDGRINPGGPTEGRLNRSLEKMARRVGRRKPSNRLVAASTPWVALGWIERFLRGETDDEEERKRQCDEMFGREQEICREIRRQKGRSAARRCWESIQLRYSNCLVGRPLPPLDLGD